MELSKKTNLIKTDIGIKWMPPVAAEFINAAQMPYTIIIPQVIVACGCAITSINFEAETMRINTKLDLCNFAQVTFLKAEVWDFVPQVT